MRLPASGKRFGQRLTRCILGRLLPLFELLARSHWIEAPLAAALKRMVAFGNIAVHDYQSLLLLILVSVISLHSGEFLEFTQAVLKRYGAGLAGLDCRATLVVAESGADSDHPAPYKARHSREGGNPARIGINVSVALDSRLRGNDEVHG